MFQNAGRVHKPGQRVNSGRTIPPVTAAQDPTVLAIKLALTDAQEQKLLWIASNGVWTLVLRPPTDAADSPESAENYWTLFEDGLKGQQIEEIVQSGLSGVTE